MPEKIFSLNFKTSMAPIDPKVKKNEQTWNIFQVVSYSRIFKLFSMPLLRTYYPPRGYDLKSIDFDIYYKKYNKPFDLGKLKQTST